jgi:hypothetical protein
MTLSNRKVFFAILLLVGLEISGRLTVTAVEEAEEASAERSTSWESEEEDGLDRWEKRALAIGPADYDDKKMMSEEKMESVAKLLIDYHKLLKFSRLNINQKQIILYKLNKLMLRMNRYFLDFPESEHLFERVLVKLTNNQEKKYLVNKELMESSKANPDHQPFKWGK